MKAELPLQEPGRVRSFSLGTNAPYCDSCRGERVRDTMVFDCVSGVSVMVVGREVAVVVAVP